MRYSKTQHLTAPKRGKSTYKAVQLNVPVKTAREGIPQVINHTTTRVTLAAHTVDKCLSTLMLPHDEGQVR